MILSCPLSLSDMIICSTPCSCTVLYFLDGSTVEYNRLLWYQVISDQCNVRHNRPVSSLLAFSTAGEAVPVRLALFHDQNLAAAHTFFIMLYHF